MCATHSLAIAQVNKCTQPDGTIIFSDKPCQNSKRLPRIEPQLGRSTQPMDERAAAEQRSLDSTRPKSACFETFRHPAQFVVALLMLS